MPQALIQRVIDCLREVGRQPRNPALVQTAAERLRSAGMEVITFFSIPVYLKGRHTRGFIDMVVIDDGIMLGMEVDRLTPRERSIQKLRAARLDFRLIVLTHPGASVTALPIGGIDAVVALQHRKSAVPSEITSALVGGTHDKSQTGHMNAEARMYRRMYRDQRIDRRTELRQAGRTPAKEQYVYRVAPEVIAIPDWAFERAVRDIEPTPECVWLWSHALAMKLCRLDRDEGGHPDLTRIQAKRCQICGLLKLNILAQHRSNLDESAIDGRSLPCNPECLKLRRIRSGGKSDH
jgi:hypothetical protein